MPRVPATLDHAQAALSAARGAGLAVERAEVARVASNVLVRLEPGPFAARLTGATEGFRDSTANLRREARIATALAAAGAPVPAPLGGPYEAGGRAVTLWPWVEVRGDAGDAEQAGSALRACHDALADLDRAGLELEPLAMLTEARRLAAGALPEILPAVDHALATLARRRTGSSTATAIPATCCGRPAARCGATGRTRTSPRWSGTSAAW